MNPNDTQSIKDTIRDTGAASTTLDSGVQIKARKKWGGASCEVMAVKAGEVIDSVDARGVREAALAFQDFCDMYSEIRPSE